MKKYYNFDPLTILVPPIRALVTLLAVVISVGYYLSINPVITQKGFSIPESVFPDALINQLIQQQTSQFVLGDKYIAQITPEMLQYAKEHPELLQQYGITPAQLDAVEKNQKTKSSQPSSSASSKAVQVPTTTAANPLQPSAATIKKLALEPINNLIKQYQSFVSPILALMLFSAFSFFFFLFFLFNLLSGMLLRLVFYMLEKSHFIHFEKEMREVKKLVV